MRVVLINLRNRSELNGCSGVASYCAGVGKFEVLLDNDRETGGRILLVSADNLQLAEDAQ